MSRKPKYKYADLPVFKYQVYDREQLTFSDVPIIPSGAKPPLVDEDLTDDYWKEVTAPNEPEDAVKSEDNGNSSSHEEANELAPAAEVQETGKRCSVC